MSGFLSSFVAGTKRSVFSVCPAKCSPRVEAMSPTFVTRVLPRIS